MTASNRRSGTSIIARILLAAILLAGFLGVMANNQAQAAAPNTITIISGGGAGGFGTADPVTAYSIPSLGTAGPAYIVSPNPLYATIPGTRWVNTTGTTAADQGTNRTANYTVKFSLPPGFTAPGITVQVLADNAAVVYLNGTEIGRQTQASLLANFQQISTFTWSNPTDFLAGVNTLTIADTDYGGPNGVNFKVEVAFSTAPTLGGPYSGDEGSAIPLSGVSVNDPSGLTYNWSVDSPLCGFDDASALNPSLTCSDNGSYNATLTVDYPSLVSGLNMTMYDTGGDPATAVGNGFSGLTPGTFSVTTASGTNSVTSYQVPVVNFPDNAFDIAAFYNIGPDGLNNGISATTPAGDDISIQPPGGNDTFGAAFTGYLYLPAGGNVTFQVLIDDSFKLVVNNVLVRQFLGVTDLASFVGGATGLPAGFVPITLYYGENGGEADVVLLSASGGGLPSGVIPQDYLYSTINQPLQQSVAVTVNNVAPTLGAISVDQTLVPVNTPITAGASFTDPGTADTHIAAWDWGDGTSAGTVTQGTGSGSVSDSHSYILPGVYTIKLVVTDDDGAPSNQAIYQFVVVYDPSAGFVTGGGWIDSPLGAYTADPSLTGKANFGFVAKYKRGQSTPDGNTQFQFKAGDLNFHSTSYEWLVVAGANAKFKGMGTINGQGSYYFMITATDGNLLGGGQSDGFRIKIWDAGGVIYDNMMGQLDDSNSTLNLGGGSIYIHN